jgi:hypothetical protein
VAPPLEGLPLFEAHLAIADLLADGFLVEGTVSLLGWEAPLRVAGRLLQLLELAQLMNGGAGCISATANVNPAGIFRVYSACLAKEGLAQAQARADEVRRVCQSPPMIAAMKFHLAGRYREAGWNRLRPPLVALRDAQAMQLSDSLRAIDFP